MFTSIWKKLEVFYSIIIFNFVNVMNDFFRIKIPTELFFHYKARSFDIFSLTTIRMFRTINKNISFSAFILSIFPCRMFRTSNLKILFPFIPRRTSFTSKTQILFMSFRKLFSFPMSYKSSFIFIPRNYAFFKGSFGSRISFRKSTKFISHFVLQIKKAAFSPLKRERLSSTQDLLTASYRHKKPALSLAIIIISFLLLSVNSFAAINRIAEEDGSPSVYPWEIRVPSGSMTNNGDGTASLAFLTAESDPFSWSKASDQTLLTGDKSGSFDLTTSGVIYPRTLEVGDTSNAGQVIIWAPPAAGDFTVTLKANAAATSSPTFYLPPAAPIADSLPLVGSMAGSLSWSSNFGANDILTTGTLGAGAITGTSFIIGANTLTTTEWAFLDGQDQALKTTNTPQFLRLGIGAPADATSKLYVSAAGLTEVPKFENLRAGETTSLGTGFKFVASTDADMGDGFGGGFTFYNKDSAGVENAMGRVAVVRNGADNTGKMLFGVANAGTVSNNVAIDNLGHFTVEGVTSTGATGTGKFVFDTSPTVSGTFTYSATADVYSQISSGAYLVTRTADTNPALQTYISAGGVQEANPKYVVSISGKNSWGAGGASALDTNLYRSAADTLKTDDAFDVAGNLSVGGGTITLGVDTNFVLSGGVNGVSFDTNTLSIDATNDRVGIGTTTPASTLSVWGGAGAGGLELFRFNAASVNGAYVLLGHPYHSTIGSYDYLPADNEVGKILGQAWNGTAMSTSAGIYMIADQQHASGKIGTRMDFRTTPNDSTAAPSIRMTIDSTGYVGLGVVAPAARLNLVEGTTAADGILFGSDTNLYRGAANTLQTDDSLIVGGTTTSVLRTGTPSAAVQSTCNADATIVVIDDASSIAIATECTLASAVGSRGSGFAAYENDGAAMANGDRLGFYLMGGSSSASNVRNTAGFVAYAAQDWTDGSAYGTRLDLETVKNGATARTAALSIDGYNDTSIINYLMHSGNKRTTTQLDKTNSTFAAVNQQSVTLAAGLTYRFRCYLRVDAAAGGAKFSVTGTATATNCWFRGTWYTTAGVVIASSESTTLGTAVAASTTVAASSWCVIEGDIVVNEGGTFAPRFAQNATNGTPSSVLVGSFLEVWRIA